MGFIANLNKKIKHLINLNKLRVSYAIEGEDLLIERALGHKNNGFFVDVGAYHPVKYSNTYRFYLKGWKGINIDAMPGSMDLFKKKRPKDINLEIPVADVSAILTYYIFNEQALNTFSEEEAKKKDGKGDIRLLRTEKLQTKRLEEILDRHVKPGTEIDFMSVDVEGYDLKVLQSNNWIKYKPALVLVENLVSYNTLEKALHGEISLYMKSLGYNLFAKTYNTLFFEDEKKHLF